MSAVQYSPAHGPAPDLRRPWPAKTPDQIIADVEALVKDLREGTRRPLLNFYVPELEARLRGSRMQRTIRINWDYIMGGVR